MIFLVKHEKWRFALLNLLNCGSNHWKTSINWKDRFSLLYMNPFLIFQEFFSICSECMILVVYCVPDLKFSFQNQKSSKIYFNSFGNLLIRFNQTLKSAWPDLVQKLKINFKTLTFCHSRHLHPFIQNSMPIFLLAKIERGSFYEHFPTKQD